MKEKLQSAMKAAMKAGDKQRLGVIRLALSAIKQREVDDRTTLDDAQILAVLDKMVKQRRDSIEQFNKAGRDDLVAQETFEIDVLMEYLPQPLDDAEIDALVKSSIEQSGASSLRDMGNVMNLLRPQVLGRADMGQISAKVKAHLG